MTKRKKTTRRKTTRRRKKNKPSSARYIFLLSILLAVFLLLVKGKEKTEDTFATREEFFEEMAPYAKDVGRKYGLYPSIILAQAALESDYGASQLSREYNNYFGIKGNAENGVLLPTEEIYGGNREQVDDYFRVYKNPKESFKNYGALVGTASRYQRVRDSQSPEEYAENLYNCGYSTNPNYKNLLMHIVEEYDLKKYDEDSL